MRNEKATKTLNQDIRRKILEISYAANVGHIGSAFSIVEILTALYFEIITYKTNKGKISPHDRFILSKGHAAPALYAVLHARGLMTQEAIMKYCVNGSMLEEHPNHSIPAIEVSTGSLGHGLSIGVGMALASETKKERKNIFVIMSDAECDEGETWEAALSAAHYSLDNLSVFLDYNKVQAFGSVKEVLGLEPLNDKWRSFGWNVSEVDGHDVLDIVSTWKKQKKNEKPNVIICHTIRGKGVSFMEHHIDWHYKNPNADEYRLASRELER